MYIFIIIKNIICNATLKKNQTCPLFLKVKFYSMWHMASIFLYVYICIETFVLIYTIPINIYVFLYVDKY